VNPRLADEADPLTVRDFAAAVRGRLRHDMADFIDGGADSEATVRGNESAFRTFALRPRILTDVSAIDVSVELLGRWLTAPLLTAPTTLHILAHPQGERATTVAAGLGLPVTLSTFASATRESTNGPAPMDRWAGPVDGLSARTA
jgi:isopentenyl diphosphate isomerase/L-lactate dehydrogenase-like FMN-dependent dehydrogenase